MLSVIPLVFFINIIYTMDTPGKKISPGRQLLLNSIKTRMPVCLEKKPFQRSCDKLYGNNGDCHYYCEFDPKGRYLIEGREENVASFTITDMETKESNCIPVNNRWKVLATRSKKHILVASAGGKRHLFKISLAEGKLRKNFSDKIMPFHQASDIERPYINYSHLAYNPHKSSFISVSEGSEWLVCLHDSVTGDVKNHWKDDYFSTHYSNNCISYSPNGCHCVVFSKEHVNMIDAESGKKQWTIDTNSPFSSSTDSITWHPQSSFFIINSDSGYSVVCAKTGKIITTFYDPAQRLERVSHSYYVKPDTESYTSASEYECCWVKQSFFTADGNYFISVVENNHKAIIIRDGKTYETIHFIWGDIGADPVSASFDGKYLAYGIRKSFTNYIVLYDLEQRKEVARVIVKGAGVQNLRWRPNIHQFITTEYDSTELMLWDIKSDQVCKKAFDSLKNADDWCVGFVADACNGAVGVNEIDQETYATFPESVQILLSCFKQNK
jgi:hypothetical protein